MQNRGVHAQKSHFTVNFLTERKNGRSQSLSSLIEPDRTGWLVEPHDKTQLAATLELALSLSARKYKHISSLARRKAECLFDRRNNMRSLNALFATRMATLRLSGQAPENPG